MVSIDVASLVALQVLQAREESLLRFLPDATFSKGTKNLSVSSQRFRIFFLKVRSQFVAPAVCVMCCELCPLCVSLLPPMLRDHPYTMYLHGNLSLL